MEEVIGAALVVEEAVPTTLVLEAREALAVSLGAAAAAVVVELLLAEREEMAEMAEST